jgi:hypothetical protein
LWSGNRAGGGPAFDAQDGPDEGSVLDTSVAHPARVYDYWLGGKDSYAADRSPAEALIAVRPAIVRDIRANLAFMRRTVAYLAAEGVRQFLDIGTGIPTKPNPHEVVQDIAPDTRIVYTDNDRCKSGCAHEWAAGQQQTKPLRDRPAAGSPDRSLIGKCGQFRCGRRRSGIV